MSNLVKKATRLSYGEALRDLFPKYQNMVVLDADLAEATQTKIFRQAYPARFIDCGIAESNLMGIAAGLAASGMIPFASSFAMFAAGRAFEQIRNSIAYPHLPVKIGATHAGITVGEDGATHQCNEDIALMRSIPGMTIICPADDVEAKAAVEAAILHEGPVYLRFSRFAAPVFNDFNKYRFQLGKGICLRDGNGMSIVATGLMVYEALRAAELLAQDGIHARVINIHTIKPLDEEIIMQAAKDTRLLLTVEEHSVIGGLGDAVCGLVCQNNPVPVVKIGIEDEFGHSGTAEELLKQFGLCMEHIAAVAKKALKKNQ
ncbi:transketolase family protein [Anaerosinus massiliensis]|uniref:transketolase family protein n=1 Tax=Massilibacillus massiliensis TaxID=1806837 RepID=UPI000ACD2038|nr:transketolase C-terminal domain-containing protein [Massilibacillus massiliensis]